MSATKHTVDEALAKFDLMQESTGLIMLATEAKVAG